jgi:hypothetical protein
MSIQNELTKLYKKLSEEGLNKEAQRLTPFIKESQFFTFLKPKHNRALRQINRDIRAGNTDSAKTQLQTLNDLIKDPQLMADLEKNLDQGDASGRRKFMRMLKAILKVLKAGGNVTLQTVKQEAETDAPAEEAKKETPKQEKTEEKLPQTPEADTETEDSKETKTTTELKALPTSEKDAVGDKNYKYFYNEAKKGFQVAEGSNSSVGAIIRAENKVSGVKEEYNDRLNRAYAIIHKMFKNKGYDMSKVETPTAKAEYTGPASGARYKEWTPESVGLEPAVFIESLSFEGEGLKGLYNLYKVDENKADATDLLAFNQNKQKGFKVVAVKKEDIENSGSKKVKYYHVRELTEAAGDAPATYTFAKIPEPTIVPSETEDGPDTITWDDGMEG